MFSGLLRGGALPLDVKQFGLDRADYTMGDLVLHGECVGEIAVVALAPRGRRSPPR